MLRSLARTRTVRLSRDAHALRRYTTTPIQDGDDSYVMDSLRKGTFYAARVLWRAVKLSALGVAVLGATTLTAYEAAHMWVEASALAPDPDDDARRWQWDRQAETWGGGGAGGTDPALGLRGRHAVRSAWMALNWGTGSDAPVIASNALKRRGPSAAGGLNVVDPRLQFAHAFLDTALAIAQHKAAEGKLRPGTLTALLLRDADVLERMNSAHSLWEARAQLQRAWATLPGSGADAALVALKLGDLNNRLGEKDDALAWWNRAIQLTQPSDKQAQAVSPVVPQTAPSSPLAQRALTSTLVALSAFYATTGQLKRAQAVEESSLNLLRSIPTPPSLSSATSPQALHHFYILHRSSLLSIHLAEVLFALRNPADVSKGALRSAAESSERVALALAGLPPIHPDAPQSHIPHPPAAEAPLLSAFARSPALRRPAAGLLRDARRTAAEAWTLLGVLAEDAGRAAPEEALECYERALGWVGVAANLPGGIPEAGEGILEAEWKVLWGNYVRARDAVKKKGGKI